MELASNIKLMARATLKAMNIEVRRLGPAAQAPVHPPLLNDPLAALLRTQGGKPTAFRCPISRFAHQCGLNHFPGSWHPFVETLKEYRDGVATRYEDSILKRYYETWRPGSAAEALIGFSRAPANFHHLPPQCLFLSPWVAHSSDEIERDVRRWTRADLREHGGPKAMHLEHELKYFGPVTPVVGRMEFERLISVYRRIADTGYDRSCGDVSVRMLRRRGKSIYLNNGGGYHRVAAMRVLGYKTVPAVFHVPFVIDVEDVDLWPQVQSGPWSRERALAYANHLFDFDSRAWARRKGFVTAACTVASPAGTGAQEAVRE